MNKRMIALLVFTLCVCACARTHKTAAHVNRVKNYDSLAKRVHFPFASHRVISRDHTILANNARWLRENPETVIILEGHCDERGSDEFNVELGDRRARSVMAEMIKEGIDESRLIVLSRGEAEPIDDRHMPKAWRQNRRVEFILR